MPRSQMLKPLHPLTLASIAAEYLVTLIHHLYGGVALHAPERLVMAAVITGVFVGTVVLHRLAAAYGAARAALFFVAAVFWVGMMGAFEGGYNHAYQTVLYALGARYPHYPEDFVFQFTGVLTLVAALFTAAVYTGWRVKTAPIAQSA